MNQESRNDLRKERRKMHTVGREKNENRTKLVLELRSNYIYISVTITYSNTM
jgi:hypothetical protein